MLGYWKILKAKGHLSIWNYEENEKGANNK